MRKRRRLLNILSFFAIGIAIYITTIGYSAVNSNLNISGEAIVKVDRSISIINLQTYAAEGGAFEQYNNSYHKNHIDYFLSLPNEDSSITYKISVKNRGTRDYGIAFIDGLPDNLTYEFLNYEIGDKICTGLTCNEGAVDELLLKIKYKPDGFDETNVNYQGRLLFEFDHFFSVLYINVPNSDTLKKEILRKTDFSEVIVIPEGHKLKIRENGDLLKIGIDYDYDENTNVLTVYEVFSNLAIELELIGTEHDTSIIVPEGKFSYTNVDFDINENTFYLEADVSSIALDEEFENIISIGNDIDIWQVRTNYPMGVNLHIYYPAVVNTRSIQCDVTYRLDQESGGGGGSMKFSKVLENNNSGILRIAFNANGLYINGSKIFDASGKGQLITSSGNNLSIYLPKFFEYFMTNGLAVSIGSTEGGNRSNAIYHDVKIFDDFLTASEMIEKTRIKYEEIPVVDEVSYTLPTMVSYNGASPVPVSFPFEPNNQKFIFTDPEFVDLNSNSLYIEMDVSNIKSGALKENLISLGNDFTDWRGNNVFDIHVFYPETAGSDTVVFSFLNGNTTYGQFRASMPLIDGKLIKMMISSHGIFVNGEKWFNPEGAFKNNLTLYGQVGSSSDVVSKMFEKLIFPNDPNIHFKYGSEQGDNRSSVKYNQVRIYDGTPAEHEIIKLTS